MAMDVPADFDGRLELEEVGLAEEDLPGGGAEAADLRVGELRGARRPAAARLQEPPDHVVERRGVHPGWREGRGAGGKPWRLRRGGAGG